MLYIEGFRPEWYISTIIYSWDIPFWSETLNMLIDSTEFYFLILVWMTLTSACSQKVAGKPELLGWFFCKVSIIIHILLRMLLKYLRYLNSKLFRVTWLLFKRDNFTLVISYWKCMCAWAKTQTHSHSFTHICMHMHVYPHTRTCTYTYTCARTHTHTHTHTKCSLHSTIKELFFFFFKLDTLIPATIFNSLLSSCMVLTYIQGDSSME